MMESLYRLFNSVVKVTFIGVLITIVLGFGITINPSQALASSKPAVPPSEALDLAIGEATQEFVESLLDDYSDVIEDAFDEATEPLKSAVKDIKKQLSKATKSASKGEDTADAPQITVSPEMFQAAVASFETLAGDAEAFRTKLESVSTVVQEAVNMQFGSKLDELQKALDTVTANVNQLVEDTTDLQAGDSASTVAFSEKAMLLNESIEVVDVIIDSFED